MRENTEEGYIKYELALVSGSIVLYCIVWVSWPASPEELMFLSYVFRCLFILAICNDGARASLNLRPLTSQKKVSP